MGCVPVCCVDTPPLVCVCVRACVSKCTQARKSLYYWRGKDYPLLCTPLAFSTLGKCGHKRQACSMDLQPPCETEQLDNSCVETFHLWLKCNSPSARRAGWHLHNTIRWFLGSRELRTGRSCEGQVPEGRNRPIIKDTT